LHDGVVVGATAEFDAALDDASNQQRPGSFRAEDHLRRSTQDGVQEGVEDKGVQAIDGRDVCEGVGEGECHWQIHAGDGQGSDEVALEEGELVLAQPYQGREVVGEVPVRGMSVVGFLG
jgi:hypothetical protein